jgi:hypothetical protein
MPNDADRTGEPAGVFGADLNRSCTALSGRFLTFVCTFVVSGAQWRGHEYSVGTETGLGK